MSEDWDERDTRWNRVLGLYRWAALTIGGAVIVWILITQRRP